MGGVVRLASANKGTSTVSEMMGKMMMKITPGMVSQLNKCRNVKNIKKTNSTYIIFVDESLLLVYFSYWK